MRNFQSPSWQVSSIEENDDEHYVYGHYALQPISCAHCGSTGNHIRFGRRQQRYRDLPIHGKHVHILVQRQRCRCRDCGKIFLEPLPDMDEHHRATRRLVAYIRREAGKRSFVSIAAEVGMSEGSIRNIYRDGLHDSADDLAAEVGAHIKRS